MARSANPCNQTQTHIPRRGVCGCLAPLFLIMTPPTCTRADVSAHDRTQSNTPGIGGRTHSGLPDGAGMVRPPCPNSNKKERRR
jgi:hypothetical protein